MTILKRSKVVVEYMVLLAERGEPALCKLIDANHPDYEGWSMDWHQDTPRGTKFVLKRESPVT